MTMSNFQGLTPTQAEIIQYWSSLRQSCGRVPRSLINPGRLRAHLSGTSVIELSGETARVRLAGSKLRDIVGFEMRGRNLLDIDSPVVDSLALGLGMAIERAEPIGGRIEQSDGRTHVWLRLPMADRAGNLTLVLCHDEIISSGDQADIVRGGEIDFTTQKTAYAA